MVMAQPVFPRVAEIRDRAKRRVRELRERVRGMIRGQRARRSPVIEKPKVKTY